MHRILEGVIGRWSTRRRTAYSGLILGIALAVATAGIAVADNVLNNVTVGGNDTFPAGGSTSIKYRITATSGDGQNGCNASDGSPAVVTINTPPGVTVSPKTLTFATCFTEQLTSFSSNTPGWYLITVSVSDPGPGSYNTNPAVFTLKVLPPPDSTPPVIVPIVTGTLGDNGWYVSDVGVSWSVSDPESAISSTSGCDPATVSSDTGGQTFTCEATSLGGTSSESVTVKRDTVPPSISGSASPAPNGNGWNNTNVTVDFTCSDATSGIASCGPDATLSSDGAGQSATGTAVDEAGNLASATVSGINIDKMSPEVSVSGVTHGGHYYLGSVPAAGCSTSDNLSGVATPASLSVSGGTGPGVGTFVATCGGAVDRAGNAGAAASATYTVGFHYSGLFRPVDNLPTINRAKAGSAIPVKFSLNGNWGLNVLAAGFPKALLMTCPGSAQVDQVEETVAASSSGLQYDAASDQYTYVWKTDSKWGNTCRQLVLRLADGTEVVTHFTFTR